MLVFSQNCQKLANQQVSDNLVTIDKKDKFTFVCTYFFYYYILMQCYSACLTALHGVKLDI